MIKTEIKLLFAIILGLSLSGCAAELKGGRMSESIGSAQMLNDGVIELQLKAEGVSGLVGDTLINIKCCNRNLI